MSVLGRILVDSWTTETVTTCSCSRYVTQRDWKARGQVGEGAGRVSSCSDPWDMQSLLLNVIGVSAGDLARPIGLSSIRSPAALHGREPTRIGCRDGEGSPLWRLIS